VMLSKDRSVAYLPTGEAVDRPALAGERKSEPGRRAWGPGATRPGISSARNQARRKTRPERWGWETEGPVACAFPPARFTLRGHVSVIR
jgi:hypothetical protein